MTHRKLLCAVAGASIFLFPWAVHAQGAASATADAQALVRAMRADVVILEGSKAGVSRASREGYFTAAQFECLEQLPASAFTADLGAVLSRMLTREEISQALEFYSSPVGVKFLDMQFVALARSAAASGLSFGGKPTVPNPSMSVDEMRQAQAFLDSDIGIKLERDKLLMKSPETGVISKRVTGKKLAACGAKVPPLP